MSEGRSPGSQGYRGRLGKGPQRTDSDNGKAVNVRKSLFDPIVIAAILGLLGGGVTVTVSSEDAQRRHEAELSAEKREGICNRAFAFLQDEDVSPKLEQDNAFYQLQLKIAERCSAEGKKP